LHPALVITDPTHIRQRFAQHFGGDARVFSAPGRVNLIGEHTDYNDGFVMPVAIDRSTYVAITTRADRRLTVVSETLSDTAAAPLDSLQPRRHWSDYVMGVAAVLREVGVPIPGANLLIASDVPLGAGLSSSAALEVAVALALLSATDAVIDSVALAELCQRAENEFVGARVGIMDQFVALHGRSGHALRLDCRSLEYKLLPLPTDVKLVVANTMVKHALAANEYNARRADCEGAVQALAARLPGVKALRDVTPADLEEHVSLLSPTEHKRARHIVSENSRVESASEALAAGNIDALGPLFAASHQSLRDDFEVSCRELDALVVAAASAPGARAARMTGGGFGGCTINLVAHQAVDGFITTVGTTYQNRVGTAPEFYVCIASDGARALTEA
jgi:galactokinase